LLMATLTTGISEDFALLPVVWAGLLIWCIPGWDNYWSAAIGNPTDITKKSFAPTDFIMKAFAWLPLRIWGTVAMGLRQFICLSPLMVTLAFLGHPIAILASLIALLAGIPYLIGGYVVSKGYSVAFGEYGVGIFVLGTMFSIIFA
jgi:hypothetical protein